MTGADIESMMNEAAIIAVRNNQEFIDYHYKGEIRHYTVFNPTDLDFLNQRNIEYFYVIET